MKQSGDVKDDGGGMKGELMSARVGRIAYQIIVVILLHLHLFGLDLGAAPGLIIILTVSVWLAELFLKALGKLGSKLSQWSVDDAR